MRRGRLERKTPLRARKLLKKRTGLRARRSNPMSVTEREARALWASSLGGCVICAAEGGTCSGPVQAHHAVAKQALKRRNLRAHLWDVRNRVPVCERRHAQHTTGFRPIPFELLPAPVFEFADELGLGWWLTRFYPSREVAA